MNDETAAPAVTRPQFALTPKTLDEAMQFAKLLAGSSIVPKDYQGNPGNILVAVQWGAEIGLAPLQAMQSIAVINGRPSIWGDAMLALVRASGLLVSLDEEIGDTLARCTVRRRGDAEDVVREFSMEDAKRAGLSGKSGPWQQYPKRMLQLRARAYALRDAFPDVLRGVHIAEEAQDIPPESPAIEAGSSKRAITDKSRAGRVRAALAKDATAQPPAESCSAVVEATTVDVMAALASAATMDELRVAGEIAGRLLASDQDKAAARAEYVRRKHELEASAS